MKKTVLAVFIISLFAFGCSSAQKNNDQATSASSAQPSTAGTQTSSVTHMTQAEEMKYACVKNTDNRLLEVISKDQGCELNYKKGKSNHVAASSRHGEKHCMEAEKKIKTHLEKAGFTCSTAT